MKRKILCVLLVVITLFSACATSNEIVEVSNSWVKRQDMGHAMPELLFVEQGNIVFWSEFGLFVIDTQDGSVVQSVDLSKLTSNEQKGCNWMTGAVITNFWTAEDKQSVYFMNTGSDTYANAKPHQLVLKDLQLKENVSEELDILPPAKAYSFDFVGGEPEGYKSNLLLDDGVFYYLFSREWRASDLRLISYNRETGEEKILPLFV